MTRENSYFASPWSLAVILCMLAGFQLSPGCARHRSCQQNQHAAECRHCKEGLPQIQRRFFVSPQGQLGLNGEPGSFAREIVAELNALPCCSAILLPLDFPIDAPVGQTPGPSQELLKFIDSAGPSPAVDELLIVYVTDVVPFRPMRLTAIMERRSIADGVVLSRDHRTWNAPMDMDPVGPSAPNRKLLNNPPPLGIVESHEMNRLSPKTFQHNVASEVARELSNLPL